MHLILEVHQRRSVALAEALAGGQLEPAKSFQDRHPAFVLEAVSPPLMLIRRSSRNPSPRAAAAAEFVCTDVTDQSILALRITAILTMTKEMRTEVNRCGRCGS